MNFALRRRPRVRKFTVQRRRRRRFRAGGVRRRQSNRRTGGFIGTELKFRDFELDSEAFTTAWAAKNPTSPSCLSAVEQGNSESQRNGRKIWIHSLFIRGEIILPVAEGSTFPHATHHFRLCLVLDTQCNGAEVVATDVMRATITNDYLAFRNLENTTRYKVLWDRTFTILPNVLNEGAANLFARGAVKRIFKIMKTFRTPMQVQFTGTASPPTVAQVNDNCLHIIGIGTNVTATLSYVSRLRFKG